MQPSPRTTESCQRDAQRVNTPGATCGILCQQPVAAATSAAASSYFKERDLTWKQNAVHLSVCRWAVLVAISYHRFGRALVGVQRRQLQPQGGPHPAPPCAYICRFDCVRVCAWMSWRGCMSTSEKLVKCVHLYETPYVDGLPKLVDRTACYCSRRRRNEKRSCKTNGRILLDEADTCHHHHPAVLFVELQYRQGFVPVQSLSFALNSTLCHCRP